MGLGGPPVRSWRKSHGYLRCSYDRSHGHAGAVLRTRKRFRKHRQLADHRVQADGHELRRPDPRCDAVQAARRQRGRQCAHDQHDPGRRPGRHDRNLYGDQRRRLLRRAEALELHRQPAGVRRHRPLHPPRRFPARQERLPGQRRRLLSHGHPGRSVDRQPGRQRSDAAAVPERLPAGAGHHADRVSRQPGRLSAHAQCGCRHPAFRTARSDDVLLQPGRRRAHRGQDHRLRHATRRRHRRRVGHRHVRRAGRDAIGRRQWRHIADHRDAVGRRSHQLRHRVRRHRYAQRRHERYQRHGGPECGCHGVDRHLGRHQQAADRCRQRRLRLRDQCLFDRHPDHAPRPRGRRCAPVVQSLGPGRLPGRDAEHRRRGEQLHHHVRYRRP